MKIGIISFAHMHAYSYADCIQRIADVELCAIAEENKDLGAKLAAQYATRHFLDYRELLATDVDAVIITSENARHEEMAIAAAAAGKHILCEKPINSSRDGALKMIDACRQSTKGNVKFQMAFPCRFSTPIKRAKELIDSGVMGKIRAINGTNHGKMPGGWFIEKALSGGGAIMDHTVHVVDLMRWFLNAEVTKVFAEIDTRFYDIDIDDCGMLMLEFDNGVFASLDPSWSRPKKSFPTWGDVTMEIIADNGTLFVDAFKQEIKVFSESRPGHYVSFWGDSMDMELVKSFIACVRDDQQPAVTAIDGLRALEVALAAYASAESGEPVELAQLWR